MQEVSKTGQESIFGGVYWIVKSLGSLPACDLINVTLIIARYKRKLLTIQYLPAGDAVNTRTRCNYLIYATKSSVVCILDA